MTKHVFVGGLHRSGTSLVARWLASAPGATGFRDTGVWEDEAQHLQDRLLPARLLGGPGRFARHPAAAAGRLPDGETGRLRSALDTAWGPLWDGAAEVRVAKSPPDMLRGPLLQQLFPGALLVVVRRHPLAVALATRAMARRFRDRDIAELVEHWVIAHERFETQRPSLGHHEVIDLAGLVSGTQTLDRCFSALGLPAVSSPEPLEDTDEKYRRQWGRLLRSRRFSRTERAKVDALAARVRALGYSIEGFERASMPLSTPFPAR